MEPQPHRTPPPPHPEREAAPPIARPVTPRRAQWTPAKQRIFLAALLDSGSVAQAARAAGMSRSSAHRLRARLPGTPFDRAWDRLLAEHARRMADPFAPDPRTEAPSPRAATPTPGRSPR